MHRDRRSGQGQAQPQGSAGAQGQLKTERLFERVHRTTLDNGVTVVSEDMPGQRSVSVGVWVGLGSRHDPPGKAGLAHLFEHMVFKGTDRRGAVRIARELEEVGGHLNAFTSREQTCFYAKVLDRDLSRAADLLCDLVAGPKLTAKDLRKERLVVMEEIRGCEDDPDELVSDMFAQALWAKQPLGEPISGSIESVTAITHADMIAHRDRILSAEVPVCVAAAGNVEHGRLVELALKGLANKAGRAPARQRDPKPSAKRVAEMIARRDVSQINAIWAKRTMTALDKDRFALSLVNLILGGGMASRLNQSVREKHGLCYSIYSFADLMLGTGAFGVSIGTEPVQAGKAVDLIRKELRKLERDGLSARDLKFAKEYAKGSSVLGLESPSSRMQNLGKSQLTLGAPRPIEDVLADVDAVTREDAARVAAKEISADGWTLAAVVPEGFKGSLSLG